MNINSTLLNKVTPYLYEYSCEEREIEHFLTGQIYFLDRQEEAIRIISAILAAHGKEELLGCLADLAIVETKIRELEPWVRDHVVHALLTFILGIYINEEFLKKMDNSAVNNFQWKLSGLLHDIGYPIEIAKNVMKPFSNTLNKLRRRFGASKLVTFPIMPLQLERLTNGNSSLHLIQKQLESWELSIDTTREYSKMKRADKVCHGIISSLVVLNVIDVMYQHFNPGRKYDTIYARRSNINWNQKYFVEDIIPACSAIFIHNLPSNAFSKAKIKCSKAPLPFLLKLCDCLQDWERPSFERQTGLPAYLYDIKIQDGNILFYADIPKEDKVKLEQSIYSCLDTKSVQII